jgi:hypothetical protein
MTRWIGTAVRMAAMALVALVLGHNLIFLAGYGSAFGPAMAHTGHDHGWGAAVAISLSLGFALLLAAAWRLHRLHSAARAMHAVRLPAEPGARAFLLRLIPWWLALTLATAALFVLQENVESARVTAHLPGISVLASATYPNALAIIAAVALAVSLVTVLLGWKLEILIARIRATALRHERHTRSPLPRIEPRERRQRSILGSRLAGRAPPRFAS